jgi:hypothetical protein
MNPKKEIRDSAKQPENFWRGLPWGLRHRLFTAYRFSASPPFRNQLVSATMTSMVRNSTRSCGIGAWSRQALDPAAADRIDRRHEHDRHGAAWRHIEAEHIGGPAPVLLPLAVDFLTLGAKQAKVNGL